MSSGKVKIPKTAMVLAAGMGKRMRPITNIIPKPMVMVAGRTLLDRSLDRLEDVGVRTAVVNTHYLGDRIEQHLKKRKVPQIVLSPEEDLLETGGGVKNALDKLGDEPFFVVNSDAMILNGSQVALKRLAERWNPDEMDALLLLHSTVEAYGYDGTGDFEMDPLGTIVRKQERQIAPYLFTGIQILHPKVFEDTPEGPFSLNVIYTKLIEEGRLFGIDHDGEWFHVGTPEGLAQAESYMGVRYSGSRRRRVI
ncbi:MAG: nucleotidyltransferase family protein [Alphaproteobacteria bacterium]|nr:nucleotidyltransferase family protein [Rhodospirillales bacterium]MCW9045879.1 nucleotidyltransferase family protein [Alphaproteobacteria bacterium]